MAIQSCTLQLSEPERLSNHVLYSSQSQGDCPIMYCTALGAREIVQSCTLQLSEPESGLTSNTQNTEIEVFSILKKNAVLGSSFISPTKEEYG